MASTNILDLPNEILRDIIDLLPQKTIRTPESTYTILPKLDALQISLTCQRFKALLLYRTYRTIFLRNIAQLSDFAKSCEYGEFTRTVIARWNNYGQLEVDNSKDEYLYISKTIERVLVKIPNIEYIDFDFPGSCEILPYSIKNAIIKCRKDGSATLRFLKYIELRNGRYYFHPSTIQSLNTFAILPKLQKLIVNGNCGYNDGYNRPDNVSRLVSWDDDLFEIKHESILSSLAERDFSALSTLVLIGLVGLNDQVMEDVLFRGCHRVSHLTIRDCRFITLKGIVRVLKVIGPNLHELSLAVVKQKKDNQQITFSEDEHLCPIIRKYTTLINAEIYTNQLCREIFYPPVIPNISSNINIPTPPRTPDRDRSDITSITSHPARDIDTQGHSRPSTPLTISSDTEPQSYFLSPSQALALAEPEPWTIDFVSLRIPYDSSSFMNQNGPSPEQRETTLCDGSPAQELLNIVETAWEEKLIGKVGKVTGHNKFGPHMLLRLN